MFAISRGLYRARPLAAALALAAAASAGAQPKADASSAPGKSGYTLFNPTPHQVMRDMSTDRPDTTESPYTVDAGRFQIELSFADYTYDRDNEDAQTRRSFAVAPMLLKAGLLNNVDLQLGLDPYTREKAADHAADAPRTIDGFGDTALRLKVNLWGNDGGQTALAIMPFVKFPTANRDLGNGNVEGGIIAPVCIALPNGFSLGLMAEFDFRRSGADDRHVVDFVHTATVGRALIGNLGGYAECAGFANLSGDEDYIAHFSTGLTYGLTPDILLDAGIRAGLTEAAEDFGLFAGASWRF